VEGREFVSRAGKKLYFALETFDIPVNNKVCVDLGCSTGGFVDCLLQSGAKKVYAVDTGYGVLDWNLRNDDRVVVKERTNALHIDSDDIVESVEVVTVDVGWTPQHLILPRARELLQGSGDIISLVKPHYELRHYDLPKDYLQQGKIVESKVEDVVKHVKNDLASKGINVKEYAKSPVRGKKGGNIEYLFWIEG
jgi:23S rRNA (cytidine1920-2'-O)/16S rRNA (cytidine1409-2'-O)-methyltransferase